MNTVGCYAWAKLWKVVDRGLKYCNFAFSLFFLKNNIYLFICNGS